MSDELRIAAYGLSIGRDTYNLDNMYINGRSITNAEEKKTTISKVSRGDFQVYGVCDADAGVSDRAKSAPNAGEPFRAMAELQSDMEGAKKIEKEKIWRFLKDCSRKIQDRNDSLDQPEAGVSYAGLFFHGNRGLAVHVGDSRIYVIRGGRILQITEDHLEFADLYHKGIITQDQMDIHKKDSKLSAYLGMEDLEEIDEEVFSKYFIFYPGDIFLICTDGLSDTLRNGDLERLVRSLRTEEDMVAGLMKALGQRILDKSDADSTVVLLRIEDTEGEAPVRGASTIPRKENYEKREEARTEETAGRARTTAPARPTKTTEEPEPVRRKPVHTPPEEDEEEEYREESLLDQVMKNPRLLAIILCVVVILILLVVLIFKLSKNGGQDSEVSRPNVESQIESKTDTESSQTESGSESQTTESGTESAQESQQESKEESQQESKEESKEESREESKEESASTETTQTYTVAEGDTCYSICMKYYEEGTTEICEALARYNGLDDPTLIWVGQTLKIPPRSELGQ